MNWVRKHKLLAPEALQYNRESYIKLDILWQALYLIFNLAQNWQINPNILNEVLSKPIRS